MSIILKNIKAHLFSELFICTMASTVPLLYIFYSSDDINQFVEYSKSFISSGFILYYTATLSVVYVLTYFTLNRFRQKRIAKLYQLFSTLGAGIINIYRLASGSLFAAIVVFLLESKGEVDAKDIIFFLYVTPFFFLFTCFLVSADEYMNKKMAMYLNSLSRENL